MPEADPERRTCTGALLVYGSDVPGRTFEMLGVQLELLLGELDRSMARAETSQFNWKTPGPPHPGQRVLIAPDPVPRGRAAGTASRILERARRGISVLTAGPRRPPMFTDAALEHLEWIARAIENEEISRLAFYADGMQEEITALTLSNLRRVIERQESDS